MSQKVIYTHNRFDGGMTDDIRDVPTQSAALSQMALIKHCDIYRNRSVLYTMPGFLSRDSFADTGNTDVKQYDIRAFNFEIATLAVGTKSDGTGAKLLQFDETLKYWKVPTDASWQTEATSNLAQRPFLHWINPHFYYPVATSSPDTTYIVEHGISASPNPDEDWATYLAAVQVTGQFKIKRVFDGSDYIGADGETGLKKITSSGLTDKSTTLTVRDFGTGNYQVGIAGSTNNPVRSQVLQWDTQSLLNDENVQVGNGRARVIGYPNGVWTVVMDESMTSFTTSDIEANGTPSMSVKVISGETAETVYRVFSPNNTNAVVETIVGGYRDAMAWYAKIPTDTGHNEGVWAFGRGELGGLAGVSILLDTSSLGRVETCAWRGFDCWFAHNQDGSVSQLDDFTTGTYNVDATLETLVYGAKSPYLKSLDGITINTSELSTQSVQVQYRVDRDTSWTNMGTSTSGQRHSFTKAEGGVIGRFQEIQFRIILSGKIEVTGITIQLTETDDLPY